MPNVPICNFYNLALGHLIEFNSTIQMLSVVEHAFNPSTREAQVGRSLLV